MKNKFLFIILFTTTLSFSQKQQGFWDVQRTTYETVSIKSGEKKLVSSADFPAGTTEILIRITTLDENKQITNSLVSLLKAIPDPSGISQGSAGAIFLSSTLAGDDTFTYAIFTKKEEAENFVQDKKNTPCFTQLTPTNKDVKLFSYPQLCVLQDLKKIYFVVKSENWLLKQKIQLEIVPWVDYTKQRGWNNGTKNEILKYIKNLDVYTQIENTSKFSGCMLEKIMNDYTYAQYKDLLIAEKINYIEKIKLICLESSGEWKTFLNRSRKKVDELIIQKKYDEAIEILENKIFPSGKVSFEDYNNLGYIYLITNQLTKSIETYNLGIAKFPSQLQLQLNLAHALFFNTSFREAKAIHKKFENQNINTSISWKKQVELDFENFKKLSFDEALLKKYKNMLR